MLQIIAEGYWGEGKGEVVDTNVAVKGSRSQSHIYTDVQHELFQFSFTKCN
jgi:alpha/beta superfamily hydrolase